MGPLCTRQIRSSLRSHLQERVKKGDLRGSYDDDFWFQTRDEEVRGLVYDIEPKSKPLAYTKTERFKNSRYVRGVSGYTGGMGIPGVAEFEKFINDGGLVVTLGSASLLSAGVRTTRNG
jgi:hypothetical protein